ncbi:Methionyl-tRNA formyltransferase [Camellia lanceoleosa]|uniref:Methionyl-tRNA formyltransferase n=1 Tax=Camellia lanceoleosa TaxID=1840588 RepID=A0ACC0GI44_9ERIC|nr:Methionyl-tRNA formyltransferase [Camellia lanceoleosa]
MLRHFCCFNATHCLSFSANSSTQKKQLVFLGSPQVSASVLEALFDASSVPGSLFEVAAIVTQPPSGRDRGRKVMPSPVAQHALDRGFPYDLIFTPERAVNIHPSLLPLYCGAAPVQRALQDGVKETGVSLAFTIRALDAGPIIACERMEVDNQIKAPDLLTFLFSQGSKLLIHELPSIFDGSARVKAQPQDDSQATLAPKISSEESWLSFDQEAIVLHNKVQAFSGWPGTRARVVAVNSGSGQQNILELKIITTRVCSSDNVQGLEVDNVTFSKGEAAYDGF